MSVSSCGSRLAGCRLGCETEMHGTERLLNAKLICSSGLLLGSEGAPGAEAEAAAPVPLVGRTAGRPHDHLLGQVCVVPVNRRPVTQHVPRQGPQSQEITAGFQGCPLLQQSRSGELASLRVSHNHWMQRLKSCSLATKQRIILRLIAHIDIPCS
jgi:hypothetical protein